MDLNVTITVSTLSVRQSQIIMGSVCSDATCRVVRLQCSIACQFTPVLLD